LTKQRRFYIIRLQIANGGFPMKDYLNSNSSFRFVFPIDGDCLNKYDGVEAGKKLTFTAKVAAPSGHSIEICGIKAAEQNGIYEASVEICNRESTLSAIDKTTGEECKIKVLKLPYAVGGYRLSSDDNLLFLWDINENKNNYKSIFENPYLAVYKKAHDLYGAKVHVNLFYELDDEANTYFTPRRQYFNLSMMTDKFKDEFIANSDWLKFTFHSRSEKPNAPYRNASAEVVAEDCKKIHEQIIRFAGKEVISDCTTVHFGATTRDGAIALRKLGYKAMTGYFEPPTRVSYYAPEELVKHIFDRDFWYDTETDILFGRIDHVLNTQTNEKNLEDLRETISSPTRGGFISVMIHEQYFYPDYSQHLPDFEARVFDACKLISEAGYVGRHITEVLNKA
jgi:hypothetical protein